jgi:hypothetical protein
MWVKNINLHAYEIDQGNEIRYIRENISVSMLIWTRWIKVKIIFVKERISSPIFMHVLNLSEKYGYESKSVSIFMNLLNWNRNKCIKDSMLISIYLIVSDSNRPIIMGKKNMNP